MSSRLFQEVREKRGLCYSIYTFHAPYSDTGFFGLYTGTDPADAPEMMEVIVDVINDAVETLTEAEIARAKAQMKAGLLMALESCSSRAEQLARHVLAYGRPLTVEELVARIDAVSVESTRNAARGLLSRSRPAVVALGSGRGLDTAVAFAEGLTRSKGARALPALNGAAFGAGPGRGEYHEMALFRLPSSGPAALAPRGHGLLLRAPQMSDFLQWAHLREYSREYLTPWEPIWPSDDLTRSGFRRRLRRYAEDIAADRSYPFIDVPGDRRRDDRRRDAGQCPPRHRAGRHDRLLGRAAPCRIAAT